MAYDLFMARMQNLSPDLVVGTRMVEATNMIQDKTFLNDQAYRKGWIYDWDMEPLEEVEFKWEKIKTHHAEGVEVEYFIHFRPGYNPEFKFGDRYFKDDDIERLGFYVDVWDSVRQTYEKWLIVGKDDRVAFDRYNAFKCNWCIEWIYEGQYYNCIGCVRPATDSSFNTSSYDKLGGSTIDGQLSITVPSSAKTKTILLGAKFVISDNVLNPQTFQVTKITDTQPFGVTRLFVKQRVFNPHTDVYGVVNEMTNTEFLFDLPIEDLPREYGGAYHRICDCIKSKGLPVADVTEVEIEADNDVLYINGSSVKCIASFPALVSPNDYTWGYKIDGQNYTKEELAEYFTINEEDDVVTVRCINKVMAKYILTIFIMDGNGSEFCPLDLEVRL